MKTIEERAKLASQGYEDDGYSAGLYMGYIVGAEEQKVIDIDKACKWLKENARDYACASVRCPYGEEEEIICDVHLEIVEDFRKAMEE